MNNEKHIEIKGFTTKLDFIPTHELGSWYLRDKVIELVSPEKRA